MHRDFEEMVRKLSPTLRRITYKLNGHFSFFDDDDLFQEALEHLWIAFQKGSLQNKTDSYILQGCYFHLKNHLRKTLDKMKLLSMDSITGEEEPGLERFLIFEDTAVFDEADTNSLMKKLRKDGLTRREAKVLSLSMDGFTTRQIGARMGVSHVMIVKIKTGIKNKHSAFKTGLKDGYQN